MKNLGVVLLAFATLGGSVGADSRACAGWMSSAKARHDCCAKMDNLAPNAASSCCAMAQQSRDRGPVQAHVTPALPQIIDVAAHLLGVLNVPALGPYVFAGFSPPRDPSVPFYVQHRALLI